MHWSPVAFIPFAHTQWLLVTSVLAVALLVLVLGSLVMVGGSVLAMGGDVDEDVF